jgi:hypothetical protein
MAYRGDVYLKARPAIPRLIQIGLGLVALFTFIARNRIDARIPNDLEREVLPGAVDSQASASGNSYHLFGKHRLAKPYASFRPGCSRLDGGQQAVCRPQTRYASPAPRVGCGSSRQGG